MASVLLLNVLWMAFELQVHGSESGPLGDLASSPFYPLMLTVLHGDHNRVGGGGGGGA